MILLLLACAAPLETGPHETGEGRESLADSGDTADSAEEAAPVFANPPEAEDLDEDSEVLHVRLSAAPATHTFALPDAEGGPVFVEGYAYNGLLPGPTLRARVGDTVIVELENELDEPTTVHWHGLHVPFEVDGVPWMMDPVEPGESATYTFTLDAPGTFWYHPHFDSHEQVDAGLYGAFIVEDPDEPATDEELILFLDDWDFANAGTPAGGEDDHGMDGMAGRWTVGGLVDPEIQLSGGTRVRARVLNVSNTGYLWLSWPDMRVIAQDQGLLAGLSEEPELLGPGDRLEAEWRVGEDGFDVTDLGWTQHGGATGMESVLVSVRVQDPAPAPEALDWPFSGALPGEDPGTTDLLFSLSGDTGTGEWFINGQQWPDVDIPTVPLGEEAILEVRNISPTSHPFHLHGMPMEILSIDGVAPPLLRVDDTVDVPVYSVLRARILADYAGDWMAHCHILPHAEGGMMTVLRVEEASTARVR